MKKSTSVLRQAIVSHLVERLKVSYHLDWIADTLAGDQVSDREIDAALAFRSDSELSELRSALTRLENGTYGHCLNCRRPIRQALLKNDPARRICPECESEFSRIHQAPVDEAALLSIALSHHR